MLRIRIRKDGVRELKVDNEVHEVPHAHELVPNPTFATAYREESLVDPLYMSVYEPDLSAHRAGWHRSVWSAHATDSAVFHTHVKDRSVLCVERRLLRSEGKRLGLEID